MYSVAQWLTLRWKFFLTSQHPGKPFRMRSRPFEWVSARRPCGGLSLKICSVILSPGFAALALALSKCSKQLLVCALKDFQVRPTPALGYLVLMKLQIFQRKKSLFEPMNSLLLPPTPPTYLPYLPLSLIFENTSKERKRGVCYKLKLPKRTTERSRASKRMMLFLWRGRRGLRGSWNRRQSLVLTMRLQQIRIQKQICSGLNHPILSLLPCLPNPPLKWRDIPRILPLQFCTLNLSGLVWRRKKRQVGLRHRQTLRRLLKPIVKKLTTQRVQKSKRSEQWQVKRWMIGWKAVRHHCRSKASVVVFIWCIRLCMNFGFQSVLPLLYQSAFTFYRVHVCMVMVRRLNEVWLQESIAVLRMKLCSSTHLCKFDADVVHYYLANACSFANSAIVLVIL